MPGGLGTWPLKGLMGPVRRAQLRASVEGRCAEGSRAEGSRAAAEPTERVHEEPAQVRHRPRQWDALLDLNAQVYASHTWLGGRWVGALFARRTLPAHTKVAEYSGPLMSEEELRCHIRAVPVGGDQYMLDARRVSDLQGVVKIDGTPRGRGGNIAGYANHANETVANAAPFDEAHRPPPRHTGDTYVVRYAPQSA